jgi:hypothetical protein
LTVAEGNFDHPVNGQKVNERAARPAPGQGTALERAVDEGPSMRLRAHIERECVYRKRLRLYRNAARHYIVHHARLFVLPKYLRAYRHETS